MNEISASSAVHVHAVIRQGGRFLMLYSEQFCYYKFPHGQLLPDETATLAVCRIVSSQTGLTIMTAGIRPLFTVNAQNDDGEVQIHEYYICKVSGDLADAVYPDSSRFRAEAVTRAEALSVNAQGDHGILSDDVRLQAVLEREKLVLRSCRRISPLLLSILAAAGSVLIPLIGGLSCLLFGFHSPTDGGYVYGADAFLVGLVLGIFPAGPALTISIVSLALSLHNRKKAVQSPAAYILPLIALGIMLLYLSITASFGNS